MKKFLSILFALALFGCGGKSLEEVVAENCEDIKEYKCHYLDEDECNEIKAQLCAEQ